MLGTAWKQVADMVAASGSRKLSAHISNLKQEAERVNWECGVTSKLKAPITHFLQEGIS